MTLEPHVVFRQFKGRPMLGCKVELSLGCAGREAIERATFLAAAEAPKRVPEVDTTKFAGDCTAHAA